MTGDQAHPKPSIDWKKEFVHLWGYCEHILKEKNIYVNQILGKNVG